MAVQDTQKPGISQPNSRLDEQMPEPGLQISQLNHPAASEAELPAEYAEESPELLRWRADTLLDEMMLGGMDASAGGRGSDDHSASYTASSSAEPAAQPNPWTNGRHFAEEAEGPQESSAAERVWVGNSPTTSSHSDSHSPGSMEATAENRSRQSNADHETETQNRPYPNGHATSNGSQVDPHRGAAAHAPTASDPLSQSEFVVAPFPSTYGNGTHGNGGATVTNETTNETIDEHARADETQHDLLRPPSAVNSTYSQRGEGVAAGAPSDSTPPSQSGVQQPASAAPVNQPNMAPQPARMIDDYVANQAHQREQERRQWSIMTGRSNDYPTSVPRSAASEAASPAWGGHPANGAQAYEQGADAYQNQSMPFADSMAVGPQARRRSNMLPRQSEPDMEMMRQDILSLQERVDTALPIGQDTLERAHHLIEKAKGLLAFGPDRSAEISYYTQQVRSILQRAEQRLFWSNIYRRRLITYLVGWVLLSMILLASSYLYAAEMRAFFVRMTNASPVGPMTQHFVPFLFTIAAGTLGSALGALVNMWRHSQKEYGFFDRKYGLLGVVLPLIGAFGGALIYLVAGLLLLLLRVEPASLGVFAIIPAFMAFLFGCSQEKIYGTSS